MTSIFESLLMMKVGKKLIEEYKGEMKLKKLSFDDFETLQNNYEKICRELCMIAYYKGRNSVSQEEFDRWLSEVSAYEGNKSK